MLIYRGEIKNMYVTDVEFFEGSRIVKTDSVVVKKDAPFYVGIMGRRISFDYNTYLATREEASILLNESNTGTCLFVDYGELVPEKISRKEFKQLRKTYKNNRKSQK